MRDYGKVAPTFWTDHKGRLWKVPTIIGRLKFRIPCHAALRAFVFSRDGFRCVQCGLEADAIPEGYDGRWAVGAKGDRCLVMDHTVSRRNGGTHHPDSLSTFCDGCNAIKAGLIDRHGGRV